MTAAIPTPDKPPPTPSQAPASGAKQTTSGFTAGSAFTASFTDGSDEADASTAGPTFATRRAGDQTADLVTNGQAAPPPEETAATQGTHLAGQMPRVPDASSLECRSE